MEPARVQVPLTLPLPLPLAPPMPLIDGAKSNKFYMQLNASELSAISMKGSPNSNDRDAGFYSDSSEVGSDYSSANLDGEDSPIDVTSIDSSDMKLSDLLMARNKRKSTEPTKVSHTKASAPAPAPTVHASYAKGPLKKRIRYTSTADSGVVLTPTPPIAASPTPAISATSSPTTMPLLTSSAQLPPLPLVYRPLNMLPHELMPHPAHLFMRHPGLTTLHRPWPTALYGATGYVEEQQEPLALVVRKRDVTTPTPTSMLTPTATLKSTTAYEQSKPILTDNKQKQKQQQQQQQQQRSAATCEAALAIKSKLCAAAAPASAPIELPQSPPEKCVEHTDSSNSSQFEVKSMASTSSLSSSPSLSTSSLLSSLAGGRPQQRNYKNMTRERRIEANARERTRVHTISAAYDKLRQTIPSYSDAQKLSKLDVIRVASSYILTLGRMLGEDYSADQSEPSVESCIDAITATIQNPGKVKRKKDE